jgi:predicted negative regulator of RcsB-dependent stress response
MERNMKSDHRHELKTNALADWMAHFPEWSKKNAKPLIGGTTLVILIVVAFLWSQYNNTVLAQTHRSEFTSNMANLEIVIMQVAQNSAQGEDTSITLGETSDTLGELAQNTSTKTMAALAYFKQAEMLREQIHFENGQPTIDAITDRIETAKAAYGMALEQGKANKTLTSLAQYGLGLCAEELGQFDEAGKIYQALISDDSYKGTIGQVSATNRVQAMANFNGSITFPVVEEILDPNAPDMTQILDSALGTSAQSEIGPVLPEATPSIAAPNEVNAVK